VIPAASDTETTVHASCVAVAGRGLLILGPSGAGKSALALQLMAFGAELVADDQTHLQRQGSEVIASCPAAIRGLIEARGLGLLQADTRASAPLVLVVDLSQSGHERLPPREKIVLLGKEIELVKAIQGNHFPAALLCYLKGSRLG
jgi:HPr kinase/phosphorylase